MLLQNPSADPNLTQATRLLNEVVATAPSDAEARLLLATALERSGNLAGAIEQMSIAAKFRPESIPIMLELAKLYHLQPNFERALEQINRALMSRLDASQKTQVAMLLAGQGETERAVSIMEGLPTGSIDANAGLFLADLYRKADMPAKAEARFLELLKKPNYGIIRSAADFFGSMGRTAEAEKALAALAGLELAPGAKQLALAEYQARYGEPERALEQYREVAKAQPGNGGVWTALVLQYVRLGRIVEALSAAEEGLKAAPGNQPLEKFKGEGALLKELSSDRGLMQLVASILQDPADSQTAIEALKVVAAAARMKQPWAETVSLLRPLADRAPRLVPLQTLLIQSYRILGRTADAATIALRTLKAAPGSADVAQLAAKTLADGGQWAQAITAANQWRDRTLYQPLPADMFIAEAQIRANDPAAAQRQIERYLPAAKAKPDEFPQVLLLQARILIQQGQAAKAGDLLFPMMAGSAKWRGWWVELAAVVRDPAGTAAWIERISPVIPADAIQERVALADVWFVLGMRSKQAKYRDKAKSLLDEMARGPVQNAMLVFARAVMDEQEGNNAAAEAGYRKALQLDGKQPFAQNNLAMLLAAKGGDLKEALALAQKAVENGPRVASFHDTLALVQARNKDYESAVASMQAAIRLEPRNLLWRLNLVQFYDEGGRRREATRALDEINIMVPDMARLSDDLRGRLEQLRTKLGGKAGTRPSP
jgi:Flp pilus assembly protein TadD